MSFPQLTWKDLLHTLSEFECKWLIYKFDHEKYLSTKKVITYIQVNSVDQNTMIENSEEKTVQREWPIYNQSSEPISVKNPGSFYTFMSCGYYI